MINAPQQKTPAAAASFPIDIKESAAAEKAAQAPNGSIAQAVSDYCEHDGVRHARSEIADAYQQPLADRDHDSSVHRATDGIDNLFDHAFAGMAKDSFACFPESGRRQNGRC